MKTLPDNYKKMFEAGELSIVYTKITVKFDNGDSDLVLSPDNFKVNGNSYTENGGDGFPIGLALCKTIKLSVYDAEESYINYDWYNSRIFLYSHLVFNNETPNSSTYDLFEGIFYVSDIDYSMETLNISACDFMIKTEIPGKIFSESASHVYWQTLWDYFERGVCDKISEYYNPSFDPTTDPQLYASRLETNHFSNSSTTLAVFEEQTNKNNNVTYRDILGYIAQIAGGNAIVVYEEIDGEIVPKIDIKEYDLTPLAQELIYCGKPPKNNYEDIIDCGDSSDTITDIIDCGNISDNNYVLLNKFTSAPTLKFSDITYSAIVLSVPTDRGNNQRYSSPNVPGNPTNPLKLSNPILFENVGQTPIPDVQAIADNLYNKICKVPQQLLDIYIRPFTGSYISNPLIEFMDNCFVTDKNGQVFPSFVGSNTYNYFGNSNIENNTPTVAKNNEAYYNNY